MQPECLIVQFMFEVQGQIWNQISVSVAMFKMTAKNFAERASVPQCLHISLSSRSIKDDVHRKNLEELTQACGGGGCNITKNLCINSHQCLYMQSEIVKLLQVLHQDQNPAAQAFFSIAMRAVNIMEECSTEKWLLKAVEIGDCPEHFVELHLDLYWSANVLSLASEEIGCDQFLDNLRGLWRLDMDRMVLGVGEEYNQSSIIKVHEFREKDRQNLFSKVDKVLKERSKNLRDYQVDLQLASILRDRNAGCPAPSTPPDLEKHVKSWRFKFSLLFQQGQGGSSFVVKYPWVYKKEFVLKMALKPSEELDIIKNEAKIMEKCRHPYTVAVVGCWEINSKSLIMMESMKCTLTELIKTSRPSSEREGFFPSKAIDLLLPVAKAMRCLHGKEKPIAHRDIKPDNIMCLGESEDATKLIDFGDSVEFDHRNTTSRYGVAGTYGYMAPEVRTCRSTGCDLLKADVFSFGMVFAELLIWKTPVEALCDQAKEILCRSEVNDLLERGWRPHVPHDVPVYVAFIVESCWRKSPLNRPGFGDICLMLQSAQFLLKKEDVATEEALSMVSYTDSDGVDWPIADKFTLREMLNIEKETDSQGLLREMLEARGRSENSRKRQRLGSMTCEQAGSG